MAASFEPNGEGPLGLTSGKYNNNARAAQGQRQESACFFEIKTILFTFEELLPINMSHQPLFDHESDDVRRYFTIGEIADMFNVSKSLIRFWESEFDVLRPAKNSKGDRRFTRQNIEQFRLIYHLVKERGFTLEGAKKELAATKTRQREKEAMIARLKELKGLLEEIREKL